jgi:hypothetical protein
MEQTLRQLGELLLGAIPTVVLLLMLYGLYHVIVHKPLEAVLAERRKRTQGAAEKARTDIAGDRGSCGCGCGGSRTRSAADCDSQDPDRARVGCRPCHTGIGQRPYRKPDHRNDPSSRRLRPGCSCRRAIMSKQIRICLLATGLLLASGSLFSQPQSSAPATSKSVVATSVGANQLNTEAERDLGKASVRAGEGRTPDNSEEAEENAQFKYSAGVKFVASKTGFSKEAVLVLPGHQLHHLVRDRSVDYTQGASERLCSPHG